MKRKIKREEKKTKKEDKKGIVKFIYSNFKYCLNYLKKLKYFSLFLIILFIVSLVFGYIFPSWFEQEVIKLMQELAIQTAGLNLIQLIGYIMYNNFKSAFFAFIFGVLLGVVPILVIIVNGYVLGFVVNKTVSYEGIAVLWKLFPHGIFELPAVFIGVGLGFRLGLFVFIFHGKNKLKELWKWFLDSFNVFIFVVIPLLVIAALIEGCLIKLL